MILSAKGMSKAQLRRMKSYDYRFAMLVPIGKVRQEPFLVRKAGRESAIHVYVVETIRQFLRGHKLRPRRWITKGTDLSVRQRYSSKRLVIEVETGMSYKKNKERLIRKFNILKQKFDVIIVLTNSFYKARYEYLFPDIPILLRQEILPYFEKIIDSLGYPRQRHKYYYSKPFIPYKRIKRISKNI